MLPRSTNSRMGREAARGKQSGRTQEIQRLIGRSLRAAVDLKQGFGRAHDSSRLRRDSGRWRHADSVHYRRRSVALADAIRPRSTQRKPLAGDPLVSYGGVGIRWRIYKGTPVLDLDYAEDSNAETDMNVVMNS